MPTPPATLDRETLLTHIRHAIDHLETAASGTRGITDDNICRTETTGRLNSASAALAAARHLCGTANEPPTAP